MWDYSQKVKQHFLHPRNVGQIEHPDLDATVGNIVCGDALRLMVKLDDQGRIADARFQTFGCASAIASSDALIELIRGKTIEEAERITNDDIAAYLDGLPEAKMHCSVMGMEALQKAIARYRHRPFEDEGEVVCRCFGVTDRLIEKVVRAEGLETVEQVTHWTKAGGGCGGCHEKIREIIDRVRAETAAAPRAAPGPRGPSGMTNLQRIRRIEEVVAEEIRPALQRDGGDIDLVDVLDRRVQVSLRGACAHCGVRGVTLRDLVEQTLREKVDPAIAVEEVHAPAARQPAEGETG